MNSTKLLSWIVVITMVGVAGWITWRDFVDTSPGAAGPYESQTAHSSGVDPAVLQMEYQQAVSGLMPKYEAALASGEEAALEAVKNELLALRVPQDERDIHIKLILLADRRLNGASAQEGQQSLMALQETYAWLANN